MNEQERIEQLERQVAELEAQQVKPGPERVRRAHAEIDRNVEQSGAKGYHEEKLARRAAQGLSNDDSRGSWLAKQAAEAERRRG